MEVKPRESIILVNDFDGMKKWYCDVLNFQEVKIFDVDFHYANLENTAGIKLAIGLASEMGVELTDRSKNSVVLQFEVEDVKTFLEYASSHGASTVGEAMYSEKDDFWFGSFADPEGNAHWVVDPNCP